ncbi:Uncharacterized protein SCF082_LOCUS43207 [Durusdinium trenchii]|uniref:Uncharacterized protein n=1 Tax=Durusdinium trenchii TaxID=1381693 RepID=A0ABP0QR69_9DINO
MIDRFSLGSCKSPGEARFTTTFDVPADTAVRCETVALVGTEIPERVALLEAVDSAGATATHFVVYQAAPLAVLFTDYDLDVNELGGNISWQQPSLDTSLISHYLDYVLVYAQSTWAEQTTPAYIKIDLDIVDLSGTLEWTPPENVSDEVITYAVYLADDAAGLNKQLVNWTGSLSGYNLTELEASGALSYIELGEALAEATTPSFLSFAGAADNASVKEVNLTDDAAW